jgi:ketosteroid isomerase-like protein
MKTQDTTEIESVTKNLITAFLERLTARDADGMWDLFAEQIDWFVPGSIDLPWTGRRSKSGDVAVYFKTMWPHFAEGKSETALEKILIKNNDAVVFAKFTHFAKSTGRGFQTEVALHFTIQDEKIVRMHLYEDTLAVSQAFFN